MTLKTKIARFILIVLAAAAATSAPGIAQETPTATKNTLPAVRTMTAADGPSWKAPSFPKMPPRFNSAVQTTERSSC